MAFRSYDKEAVGLIEYIPKEQGALSYAQVLKELNSRNCFDFDYKPSNGDSLWVRAVNNDRDRQSFVFKRGRWRMDEGGRLGEELEPIAEGRIKIVSDSE